MRRIVWLCGLFLLHATILGCGGQPPTVVQSPPPEVTVAHPIVKEVTDYEDYSGRTAAIASVDVRARVTGYLDKVIVKEGAEVQAGDPLFDIDPRTYQAALNQADVSFFSTGSAITACASGSIRTSWLPET